MTTKKFPLFLWLAAIPFAVGACSGKPPEAASQANAPATGQSVASAARQANPAPAASAENKKPDFAVPGAPEVLQTIYQQDSHGQDAMDIANGSRATYWYGQAFELKGKRYFTGFAFNTPEKYGNPMNDDSQAPDAKVTLTASTFEAKTERGGDWSFVGSERDIGEFGARERPDQIDQARHAVTYEAADGQFLLAIPTLFAEQGSELKAWDVFSFNPGELKDVTDTHWTHVGTLPAGEDNADACDEEGNGPIACVNSIAALSFLVQQGAAMPVVRLEFSGTVIAGPGKKRTLDSADAKTYRYDPAKKKYVAQP